MTISNDKTRLTIIISKEIKKKIMKYAIEDDRSTGNYISRVLEQHIKEREQKEKPSKE